MAQDGDEDESSGVEPDDVLMEAYCAVLHGWCSALQGLLGRQGDVHHSLLLSPAVAGLWAVFLKRREMVGPIQWQEQTRKRREGNAGVQRLINILKKSSVSLPGSRLHHATHRRSAAAGKNTPTSAFPKTTNTIDTRKGKRCFERAALASHDKNSRAAAGWQAACELHRRSSRLMERQQVAHIHYEDLSLEEEEDISASSGSDLEYHPHHSRESHSLARKTKTQGKDQTSIPLMKGHCSWISEELLCKEEKREEKQREGDKKMVSKWPHPLPVSTPRSEPCA
ncbi:uncharacterized protein LOC135104861 isoform X3 [Scylla paramamosain]|uniref:uncharacterized protein LOC135104861 isoform X3 n=1 Tax=Scylla paramamosain TaxID=85552 RepID=UPI003083D208